MGKNVKPKRVADLYRKFILEFDKDWPEGCEREFWDKPLVGVYRGVTFVTNNIYMFEMFLRIQLDDCSGVDETCLRGAKYFESPKLEDKLMDEVLSGAFTSGIYLKQGLIVPRRTDINCPHGYGHMLMLAKTPENLEMLLTNIVLEHIRSVQIAYNREPQSVWGDRGLWPNKNTSFPSLSAEVVINNTAYHNETSDLFKDIDHPHYGKQFDRLSHSLRCARLKFERENRSM